MKQFILAGIIASMGIVSCTSPKTLYAWNDYGETSYEYLKKQDENSKITFEESLNHLVNKEFKKRADRKSDLNKIAPGINADYGFLLLKNGKKQEAITYFKREIALYPESTVFMTRLIKKLENETI